MKFIVAFDERDTSLGYFFSTSAKKTILDISLEQHQVVEWNHNKLSRVYVDFQLSSMHSESFVFIAFSHGHDDKFLCGGEAYLCCDQELTSFSKSIFYTFSCNTAKRIGNVLVNSGCNVYIGYVDEVYILTTYLERFIECALGGINALINGRESIQIYHDIVESYNSAIDDTYKFNSFAASIFRSNRDNLVLYGDKKVSIQSL